MQLRLDAFERVIAVAETGSLTKGAELTDVPLPAASRRLAQLEHQLRCDLFLRHSRGLELTAAGRSLLPYARTLVDTLQQAQAGLAEHTRGRSALVRIAAAASAMEHSLPRAVAAYQAANGQVRIVLNEQWSEAAAGAVKAGHADICVVWEGDWTRGLRIVPYGSDRVMALLPQSHPIRARKAWFRDLLAYDFISVEPGRSLSIQLKEEAARHGGRLRVGARVRSFDAACRMVQAGAGICLLTQRRARQYQASMDGLRAVPLADPWALRQFVLGVRPGTEVAWVEDLLGFLQGSYEA